jgi:hypothetical protein
MKMLRICFFNYAENTLQSEDLIPDHLVTV